MKDIYHVSEEGVFNLADNFKPESTFVVTCANQLDGKMAFQPRLTGRPGQVCFMCALHKYKEQLDYIEVVKLCKACARADARQKRSSKKPLVFYMNREW